MTPEERQQRGRPPIDPSTRRSAKLVVRVTDAELRQMRKMARQERLTLADWVRARVGLGEG